MPEGVRPCRPFVQGIFRLGEVPTCTVNWKLTKWNYWTLKILPRRVAAVALKHIEDFVSRRTPTKLLVNWVGRGLYLIDGSKRTPDLHNLIPSWLLQPCPTTSALSPFHYEKLETSRSEASKGCMHNEAEPHRHAPRHHTRPSSTWCWHRRPGVN